MDGRRGQENSAVVATHKTSLLPEHKAKLRQLLTPLQNSTVALARNQWQITDLLEQLRVLFEVLHAQHKVRDELRLRCVVAELFSMAGWQKLRPIEYRVICLILFI